MKPLTLTLEGFGQYLTRQEIDFRVLDSLFLITGETGAGKTTLFDAMSYALYGKGLGTRQDKSTLRSQLAGDTDSTVVVFEFLAQGTHWRMERSPYVFVRRLRTGRVETDSYSRLTRILPDGTEQQIPEEEIESTILQVLGLRHEDFSSILVLPQGQFQKFLEMDTAARTPLLKSLFPVERHSAVTQLAKTRHAIVADQLKGFDTLIEAARKEFSTDTYENDLHTLTQSLDTTATEIDVANRQTDTLTAELFQARELAKAINRHDQVSTQQTAHLDTRPEIDALASQLERARHASATMAALTLAKGGRAAILRGQAQIDASLTAANAARAKAVELASAHQELPQRRKALEVLEAAMADVGIRVSSLADLVSAEGDLKSAYRAVQTVTDQRDHALHALAGARAALDALLPLELEREALRAPCDQATQQAASLRRHESDADRIERWESATRLTHETAIAKASATVSTSRLALESAEARLADLQARLTANAALQVAMSLVEGEPCPACGSTSHPVPFRGEHDDVSDEHLQLAQESVADKRTLVSNAEAALASRSATAAADEAEVQAARHRLQAEGFDSVPAWREQLHMQDTTAVRLSAQRDALDTQLRQRPHLQSRVDDSQRTLGNAETALATAHAQRDDALRRAGALRTRLQLSEDIDASSQHRAEQTQWQADQVKARNERHAIDTLQQQWSDQQVTVAALEERLKVETQAQETLVNTQVALESDLTNAMAYHGFTHEAEVEQALLTEAGIQRHQARIDNWHGTLRVYESELATLEESLAGRSAPDLEALVAASEQSKAQLRVLTEQLERTRQEIRSLQDKHDRLADLEGKRQAIASENSALVTLAERLNGTCAPKIDFGTWMVTWWLDRVLEKATLHFSRLTDGRYTFQRQTEVVDGRRRSGLEILVTDAWSNRLREVKTLSGGEKFMASLSLALGLADVVQQGSGGVRLETLFIDEGFGSLDAETLDRVIGMLSELAAYRSVGVISHIEALKQITPQVRVTKSPGGSTVVVAGANA